MPVSGTYTWEETYDNVTVTIPWKGKSLKKVDIFLAETILKINDPPFLLDLNLHGTIDGAFCKAVYKDHHLIVSLKKSVGGEWKKLLFDGSKEELSERRKAAFRRREERVKIQLEKAKSKKIEEERMALKKQVSEKNQPSPADLIEF